MAGLLYWATAIREVRLFALQPAPMPLERPPITILKPLCGAEPGLYENLRSFCAQDYPAFQIVFGLRDEADPAVEVVRRLIAEFPDADLALVVGPRLHGSNFKVSNLINMMPAARHALLTVVDSDMRVSPHYLDAIAAALADPEVGVVTCLYAGRPTGGVWSMLGAMHINFGFLPSVLVGRRMKAAQGCFGATLALRRDTLEKIGGFETLRDHLADDYALGAAARVQGLRLELSPVIIDTTVFEPSPACLLRHELRWARTIAAIAPWAYAASIVTHPLALALLLLPLAGVDAVTLACVAVLAIARVAEIRAIERALGLSAVPLALVLPRDLLSLAILLAAFLGRKVTWRGRAFEVGRDGMLGGCR